MPKKARGEPMSDAEKTALERAYDLGLRGQRKDWIHNLGAAFDRRMHEAYAAGKREKIRRAVEAMKGRA